MSRELKVGLFVLFGLSLTALGVFLIGDTTRMWEARLNYRSAFHDVGGLKPGAPVRMGGLDIGSVVSIGYAHDLGDSRIFVKMSIVRAQAARIRADSVATVANKGLLGDKLIAISAGSGSASARDANDLIPSQEPADVFAAAQRVAVATQEARSNDEVLVVSLGQRAAVCIARCDGGIGQMLTS